MVSRYPSAGSYLKDEQAEEEMGLLIEATKTIRNMRAEVGIPTGKKARAVIAAERPESWESRVPYVRKLAWAEPLEVVARPSSYRDQESQPEYARRALAGVVKGAEIYLPLEGLVDLDKEIARLEKAISELSVDMERIGTRLSDQSFLERAPEEVVAAQRKRFDEEKEKVAALSARIEILKRARG